MPLPVIPKEEFPRRWKAVQEAMAASDIDVLFAYADDHFTYGAAYGRYYANFPAAFEPVLVMFLPDRGPILLTGPESDGYAAEVGAIPDIRVLAEFAHEDEDYPFSKLQRLDSILQETAGGRLRRVGVTCPGLMGQPTYEVIRRAAGGAEILNLDEEIATLRGVKSPAEIEVIRYAYKIAECGMKAAVAAIAPGVTERQVAAEAEYAMRKMGADGTGIDTIVASGPNARHVLARTTQRPIGKDDAVIVTVAPRYEGYHGAMGRTVLVGNPGGRMAAALQSQVKAQELCSKSLRPGVMGSRVEAMGRAVMAEAGYERNFLYSGIHSVGVIEFEPPILGPSSTALLQENMVVSIDIPTFEADINGCRTEDGYLITAEGCEPLTKVDLFIQK